MFRRPPPPPMPMRPTDVVEQPPLITVETHRRASVLPSPQGPPPPPGPPQMNTKMPFKKWGSRKSGAASSRNKEHQETLIARITSVTNSADSDIGDPTDVVQLVDLLPDGPSLALMTLRRELCKRIFVVSKKSISLLDCFSCRCSGRFMAELARKENLDFFMGILNDSDLPQELRDDLLRTIDTWVRLPSCTEDIIKFHDSFVTAGVDFPERNDGTHGSVWLNNNSFDGNHFLDDDGLEIPPEEMGAHAAFDCDLAQNTCELLFDALASKPQDRDADLLKMFADQCYEMRDRLMRLLVHLEDHAMVERVTNQSIILQQALEQYEAGIPASLDLVEDVLISQIIALEKFSSARGAATTRTLITGESKNVPSPAAAADKDFGEPSAINGILDAIQSQGLEKQRAAAGVSQDDDLARRLKALKASNDDAYAKMDDDGDDAENHDTLVVNRAKQPSDPADSKWDSYHQPKPEPVGHWGTITLHVDDAYKGRTSATENPFQNSLAVRNDGFEPAGDNDSLAGHDGFDPDDARDSDAGALAAPAALVAPPRGASRRAR